MVITTETAPRVPLLRSTPILGAASEMRRDFLGTTLRAAREVGDIARIVAGPPGWRITLYSVSTPELVFEILGHPDRFTKDVPSYRELRWALGNGMLTSEGEDWHRQRRFLAPFFTPKRIATSYAPVMAEEATKWVERHRAAAAGGLIVDAHAEMIDLTSRIIGRILFGTDMTTAIPQIKKFKSVNDELLRRGLVPHAVPMWIPTRANRQLAHGLAELRQVVADIITERRSRPAGANQADDMLGLLLNARDDQNRSDRLTDEEVADQILIFMLAGHDTTASTLACLLVELARSPQWQTTVQDEVRQVLDGRPPTPTDLRRMPWTERAVREAMRLYPAAHTIGRSPRNDEVLNGFRIPAGSIVVVSPWAVHRSPTTWKEPDTYDPRRFDLPSGQLPGGHRYAWFPFGAAPRACVGMQLAMAEVPIVVATILQTLSVTTSLTSIPLQPAISLHPATALPVQLHTGPLPATTGERVATSP